MASLNTAHCLHKTDMVTALWLILLPGMLEDKLALKMAVFGSNSRK